MISVANVIGSSDVVTNSPFVKRCGYTLPSSSSPSSRRAANAQHVSAKHCPSPTRCQSPAIEDQGVRSLVFQRDEHMVRFRGRGVKALAHDGSTSDLTECKSARALVVSRRSP